MNPDQIILLAAGAAIGATAGVSLLFLVQKLRLKGFNSLADDILKKAQDEAASLKRSAELEVQQARIDHQRELDRMRQEEKRKLEREEERIKEREDKLEKRMHLVEKKLSDIEKREAVLGGRKTQLDDEKKRITEAQNQLFSELEKVSGLSCSQAHELFLERIGNEVKTEAANLIRKTKKEAEERAEREAATIISNAINRLAVPTVSDATVNTVTLPNEEMKGRIIGREGRNIRALERATGVNFIIDDTPGAVVLSGFDPVRLQVAKYALTDLVNDGRIHPTRIEESVEKAQESIAKKIREYGEDAALRAGAINLSQELVTLLGKLKYRYSYGQNILDHSLEVAHIMGLFASELGLDIRLAKRIGLLHDIGKAVSHEIEGSHAVVGRDLALKYGETPEVANGIGCHHGEMEPTTIEASLCSAADAL
jgi:ribonuclease Y